MEGRFFKSSEVVKRLLKTYQKHSNIIVAYDFDDTISPYVLGDECILVVKLLKRVQDLGFTTILFTSRVGKDITWAKTYLHTIGLDPTYINENPSVTQFGNPAKPYFNILLDDKAGLAQAYECLLEVVTKLENSK